VITTEFIDGVKDSDLQRIRATGLEPIQLISMIIKKRM
jgi:predicted unusual protein kinase regulating ubiquinone biosynthesis (AarF/ABC1/UbiB family)